MPVNDELAKTIDDFCYSLKQFPVQIPREPTYEVMYALTHLVVGSMRVPTERKKEIDKAVGHFRRGHLDFLKILLREKHSALLPAPGVPSSPECEDFQKKLVRARISELDSIGTPHDESIANFRELLRIGQSPATLNPLESDGVYLERTFNNPLLLTEDASKLLYEWMQLEVMFVGLSGQRVYNLVLNVVNSYLDGENFEKQLAKHIALLKFLIVHLAERIDTTGIYKFCLASKDWTDKVVPAATRLKNELGDENALNILVGEISPFFEKACLFLDARPSPYNKNS